MRYLFLLMISIILLLSGCGKGSTTQEANNAGEEPSPPSEELKTSIKATKEDGKVHFILTLQNNSSRDVELTFSSGQQFEIIVLNENNEEVYRFSKDKMFTQAIETKVIEAGNQLKWEDVWEAPNIKSGNYLIKGQIMVQKTNPEVNNEQLITEEFLQLEEN